MPFTADKPAGSDTLAVSDDAIRENFRNLSPARDLFAEGFVQSGIETSINGSNQARLDVTAGIAYVKQTSSGDILRYDKETTFFTTSVASTTYYLDLNEDGTYNWGTSHSSDSNYLPIAEVTTDSAGDISSLTDTRDTKPLLDMVLEDASKVAFDDSNFGADTAAVSTVTGALNLLGADTIVDHNLDVSSPSNGYYVRWENGLQVCAIDTAQAVYEAGSLLTYNWQLPASYVDNDYSVVNSINSSGITYSGANTDLTPRHTSKVISSVDLDVRRISSATDFVSGDSALVDGITIGRWK